VGGGGAESQLLFRITTTSERAKTPLLEGSRISTSEYSGKEEGLQGRRRFIQGSGEITSVLLAGGRPCRSPLKRLFWGGGCGV